MNDILFDKIKAKCKSQGMTYKDLAIGLELSEASIKRIFSKRTCSLDHFHKICELVHIHPQELYLESHSIINPLKVNSKLETYFLENYSVFLFYRQLSFQPDTNEIKAKNNLSHKAIKYYLNELVKLNLIKIGQKNKIEFLYSQVIELPSQGRLIQKIRKEWMPFMLNKIMESPNDNKHMLETFTVSLSNQSAAKFRRKLYELEEEMFAQAERDKLTMRKDKGVGVIWAMGPYRMAIDGVIPDQKES